MITLPIIDATVHRPQVRRPFMENYPMAESYRGRSQITNTYREGLVERTLWKGQRPPKTTFEVLLRQGTGGKTCNK